MQAKIKQTSRGYLFSDRQSRRLHTEMRLSGRAITIEAGGQIRRYPVETVDISRYDGNIFEVTIGDHRLYYESDRPILFTFDFLPAMEAGRRKRSRRDRPFSPRPSRATRRAIPETTGVEVARQFDPPEEEPWTNLALGREQINIIRAVEEAGQTAHKHEWSEANHHGEEVQVCSECRQVLVDLSDTAEAERSTHAR